MTKHIHLNLVIYSRGHDEAVWRHPDASYLPLTDIRYYVDVARKAEAGLFDSLVFANSLGRPPNNGAASGCTAVTYYQMTQAIYTQRPITGAGLPCAIVRAVVCDKQEN